MLNFVKIVEQLDQDALLIFCDKGLFRILVNFTSKGKMNFRFLFKCLVDFMSVKHCIEKCIQGSEIEGSLRQTKVFNVNVVDTALNGINYKRYFDLLRQMILENGIIFWKPLT